MSKSLKDRSANLTTISLESFLNDVTAQGENYSFSELLDHANIHTVKAEFQQLLKLFVKGTYQDYLAKTYAVRELNQKQVNTLRRLTVLTAVRGADSITLARLKQLLGLGQDGVIDLLLAMNISGLINTKIDEHNGKVWILGAEVRAGKENENLQLANAKISRLLQKNERIKEKLQEITKQIE